MTTDLEENLELKPVKLRWKIGLVLLCIHAEGLGKYIDKKNTSTEP